MLSVFLRNYLVPIGGEEESKDISLLSSVDVEFDQKISRSQRPFSQAISVCIFPEFCIPFLQFSFWILVNIAFYILGASGDECRDHRV